MPFDQGTLVVPTSNAAGANFPDMMIQAKLVKKMQGPVSPGDLQRITAKVAGLRDRMRGLWGGGVCLVMSCFWLRCAMAGQFTRTDNGDLASAQTRYQAYAAMKLMKTGDTDASVAKASAKIAEEFELQLVNTTKLDAGSDFGLEMDLADPLTTSPSSYILSVAVQGGSHAIALYVADGNSLYVLDPNYGVYRYDSSGMLITDLVSLFFGGSQVYSNLTGAVLKRMEYKP